MKMTKLMTFREIVEDTSEPPNPIIDNGILLEQTILAIIGPAKTGKTFLAMNIATAIASGKNFVGFNAIGSNRVLMLCSEGGYFPNRERIKKITNGIDPYILESIHFPEFISLSITNESDYNSLDVILEDISPKILIFDPLIRFHNEEENSSNAMSGVFKRFRELIEVHKISIILIHHSGKDVTKGARGSSVINGEYDSAIYMKPIAGNIQLSFDMRHVATPDSKIVRFNGNSMWFEEAGELLNPVVSFILEHGPITKTDLVKEFQGRGMYSQSHAYRIIDEALTADLVYQDEDKLLQIQDDDNSHQSD